MAARLCGIRVFLPHLARQFSDVQVDIPGLPPLGCTQARELAGFLAEEGSWAGLSRKMVRKIWLDLGTLISWVWSEGYASHIEAIVYVECHCEQAGSHTSPLGSDTVPCG